MLLQPLVIHGMTAHALLRSTPASKRTRSAPRLLLQVLGLEVLLLLLVLVVAPRETVLHEALRAPVQLDELQVWGSARVLELVHLLASGLVAFPEDDDRGGAVRQSVVRLVVTLTLPRKGANTGHAVARRLACDADCRFVDFADDDVR